MASLYFGESKNQTTSHYQIKHTSLEFRTFFSALIFGLVPATCSAEPLNRHSMDQKQYNCEDRKEPSGWTKVNEIFFPNNLTERCDSIAKAFTEIKIVDAAYVKSEISDFTYRNDIDSVLGSISNYGSNYEYSNYLQITSPKNEARTNAADEALQDYTIVGPQ